MRHIAYFVTLTLVLVSCGTRSGRFSIEGRLLNLNQGEFYVYSPDGVFAGVDTIKVEGGRFAYETPCKDDGTIVVVFPNYSELPVFASSGESVTIKGDASHLKEVEVEGTDENELMGSFRKQILNTSPLEERQLAERFIENNPESPVSVYILRKYFVADGVTDYAKSSHLATVLNKAQPKNGEVSLIVRYLNVLKGGTTGARIPSFSMLDIKGRRVTDASLRGRVAVVYTFADWDGNSRSLCNRLNMLKKEYGDRLSLLGISLDASRRACRNFSMTDSVSSVYVCDQMMFDSPLLRKFALSSVPDNIVFDARGKVVCRSLAADELESRIRKLLN